MPEQCHLPDVPGQFGSLNTEGERLALWAGFDIPLFADDRYSAFHDGGGKDNHFQGIQRVGKYLFLTGSFPYRKKRADLFVLELGSRNADPGPWGSNLLRAREPAATDRLVACFAIDPTLWHAGSFAIQGTTLIVPLEGSGRNSVIAFVDISDPSKPKRIAGDDILRVESKAGMVAATRLPSEHLLLATWSDSEKDAGGASVPFHMELYVSSRAQPPHGFRLLGRYLPPDADDFHRSFQGLDFLWEKSAAGNRLYAIGFENTSPRQPNPTDPGRNVGSLFRVNLPGRWLEPGFDPSAESLETPIPNLMSFVDDHIFSHAGDWYNMDAGACAYVDSNQQLIVYSVFHHRAPFRNTGSAMLAVKWSEFRSTKFQERIDRIDDAWVELYEGPGPAGRRLTLLGPWDSSIENTKRCFSEDKAFTMVSAARYQIPVERAFVLYPERDFQGDGAVVLPGTGELAGTDLAGLAPYATGSCRFLPLSVATALPGVRVLA